MVKKHRVLPVTTAVATVVKATVAAQHGGDTVQVNYWSTTLWKHPVIGTDLGTTYSAAAVRDVEFGGVRVSLDENWKNTVPTYVVCTEDDERVHGK